VADAESEVVSWAFKRPFAQECAHVRRKLAVRVGVAGCRNRPCERLAFRDDEFERSVRFKSDGEHHDRPFLDVEFHARAFARLAVVLLERAENRTLRGDVKVVRSVVSNKNSIAVEVYRMELRKTAADIETVEYHHRNAVLEIELAAHRKSRRREERIADNEVLDEFARHGTGFTLIVVGETVKIALFDELLKRDRGIGLKKTKPEF